MDASVASAVRAMLQASSVSSRSAVDPMQSLKRVLNFLGDFTEKVRI
jgi:hypothetical protein